MTRAEVAVLRRCVHLLPLADVARAAAETASWLGAPLAIDPLALEHCPRGQLGQCVSDPLVAAILEPAAPVRDGRIAIEIEPRLAAIVIDRVLGGDGRGGSPAPGALLDTERGVLAYAIARMLGGQGAGGALRLVTIVTSPISLLLALGDGPVICWPGRARLGGDPGIVRAWIPERAIDRTAPDHTAGLDAPRAGAAFAGLPLTISIEGGRATLFAAELASLERGDVVVLDDAPVRRQAGGGIVGEVRARARGSSAGWRCAIEGCDLVVRGSDRSRPAPGARSARPWNEKERTEMDASDEERAAALIRTAADAPIELVVELARFEVPLGELAALAPGAVLGTGRAIGERVTLRAGDRALALGELVDIEGEVGVRILAVERHS
jgi:type III secretion system YscQ/HrcQ family protein